MTAAEIVTQLMPLGTDSYKRVLLNHGINEPVMGIKIEELKKFQKRIRKNYPLSLELYDTGIYDVQYLAGLIADERKMTRPNLCRWLARSNGHAICGTIVAAVAAESRFGNELALDWITSKREKTALTGWTTLAAFVSVVDDAQLDLGELKRLLAHVRETIHHQPNQVRYAMNSFVISVGCYVGELTDLALETAHAMGTVSVDMGQTSCKVPFAPDYIQKVRNRGTIGKKRKTARC